MLKLYIIAILILAVLLQVFVLKVTDPWNFAMGNGDVMVVTLKMLDSRLTKDWLNK